MVGQKRLLFAKLNKPKGEIEKELGRLTELPSLSLYDVLQFFWTKIAVVYISIRML